MAYPQLIDKEALPAGSRWIQNRFYFSPDGRLFMVPENGYDDFVFDLGGTDADNTSHTISNPSYKSITSAYTALLTDYYLDGNGTFTVTLPVGLEAGKTFEGFNSGSGTITYVATGGALINGGSSFTMSMGTAYKFVWTGTAYRVKY